jgi:hypothetical protein
MVFAGSGVGGVPQALVRNGQRICDPHRQPDDGIDDGFCRKYGQIHQSRARYGSN